MMDLGRARYIVTAICNRSFVTMGFPQDLDSLEGISLADMLEAARMVDNANTAARAASEITGGGYTAYVVPDDRLIAAVYTLEHYTASRDAILAVPHALGRLRALAVLLVDAPAEADEQAELAEMED